MHLDRLENHVWFKTFQWYYNLRAHYRLEYTWTGVLSKNRLYWRCIVCICFLVFLPERGIVNNDLEKVSATAPTSLKRFSIIWGRAWKKSIFRSRFTPKYKSNILIWFLLVFSHQNIYIIKKNCIMIMIIWRTCVTNCQLCVSSCIIIFNTQLNGSKLGFNLT